MRIAYFDAAYGLAGDMILGALVDAGAPFPDIKRRIEQGLGVEGIRMTRRRVERHGASATRIVVRTDPTHEHHRHLSDVEAIVDRADLPDDVREGAREAYRRLARAEAKVHRTTPEKIHFHEVGCLDAIADVTGAFLALHLLEVDAVHISPVALGSGKAHCAHGILPAPAPATVELLRGVPTRGTDFEMELTTPTGAAIVTAAARGFGPQPLMRVDLLGAGAGKRSIEGHANFLRVFIGRAGAGEGPETRKLSLLLTEIDDMNPEALGDLMPRLLDAGALDAHFCPVQMKKNRPGTQLRVLCEPRDSARFTESLLRHTTTFGVKIVEVDRACLDRRAEKVDTAFGPIEVKLGLWEGEAIKAAPEYEACRRAAERAGVTLEVVYSAARAAIHERWFGTVAKKGAT